MASALALARQRLSCAHAVAEFNWRSSGCAGKGASRLAAWGRWPVPEVKPDAKEILDHDNTMGQLESLVSPNRWEKNDKEYDGAKVNAVILDVKISQDADGKGQFFVLCQSRTPNFTSWNAGEFAVQAGVFATVLEHDGGIRFNFLAGRGPGVVIDGGSKGEGWKYYHSRRNGFGEKDGSYFEGIGRMKVALCLPYLGHGNHGSVPVWSGFISEYYADDTKALTAQKR